MELCRPGGNGSGKGSGHGFSSYRGAFLASLPTKHRGWGNRMRTHIICRITSGRWSKGERFGKEAEERGGGSGGGETEAISRR